jgi:hypothetical protein
MESFAQISIVLGIRNACAERETTVQAQANGFENRRFSGTILAANKDDGANLIPARARQEIDLLPATVHSIIQ